MEGSRSEVTGHGPQEQALHSQREMEGPRGVAPCSFGAGPTLPLAGSLLLLYHRLELQLLLQ